MKYTYLFLFLLFLGSNPLLSQHSSDTWQTITLDGVDIPEDAFTHVFATNYELFELDVASFRPDMLRENEGTRTVEVPLPNGETLAVEAQWDPVFAPGLGERFPEISTYRVLPGRTVKGGRLGWTYQGLHATLHTAEGTIYVDPYSTTDNRYYVSYYVHENIDQELWASFKCHVSGEEAFDPGVDFPGPGELSMLDAQVTGPPVVQRKYRLAMSAVPSFTNYHGGTVEGGLSALVTIINRINEVFETDMAVRVELVANNDKVIFTNAVENPFTSDVPSQVYVVNHTVLVDSIGLNNFDIGHVVTRYQNSGEGIAALGSVCRNFLNGNQLPKGAAASSRNPPQGDPFTIKILGHEMGHQFGANHTMSRCQNVRGQTAYEPGSGITIMSYNGICPDFNIPNNGEAFYHGGSLAEMLPFIRQGNGNTCGEILDFGNTSPEVELPYSNGFYVPISTPFELSAIATDAENDELTYCWEGFDIYNGFTDSIPPTSQPEGTAPLFRSFSPTTSPTRVFPQMSRVRQNNYNSVYEILPTYSRDLTFRCTVRDNAAGSGGTAWAEVAFKATASAGPFEVTGPNESIDDWSVGDYVMVTWDVANTDQAPVNCQRVTIRLSTDGGFTYPVTLIDNVPNTGSAFVTVPDIITNSARVKVEAADNIFFDISNANFSIVPPSEPGYTLTYGPNLQSVCSQEEPARVDFSTSSILGFDTTIAVSIEPVWPAEVEATLSADTIHPGEPFWFELDFSNSDFAGQLDMELRAIVSGLDTVYRTFSIEVIDSDFSELALLLPLEGESGVALTTPFFWTGLPNADRYEWELATSPSFGESVYEQVDDLAEPSYSPFLPFESNTMFFWRVRAVNGCKASDWTPTQVFHTQNNICQEDSPEDTPITIPGTGPLPTRTSEINVPFDGVISDINIPLVNVNYQPIQSFQISLISPNGTEVLLYDGNCFGTDFVNIGFDDEAPNDILCPPDDNIVFRPVEALSTFVGESSQGIWTLKVEVLETGFGVAGALNDWAIEFCATGSSEAPILITNEALAVPPGLENPISQNLLEVESALAGAAQLEYTIVSEPAHGLVKFQGEEVAIGETFRQSSINTFNVSYEHDGSMTTEDSFTFVVRDGMGGFIPIQTFTINVDENAVVNTEEPMATEAFQLFPNPTSDWVRLIVSEAAATNTPIRIFNVQGQLVRELQLLQGSQELFFDLSQQAAGLYYVQYGQATERLLIQR